MSATQNKVFFLTGVGRTSFDYKYGIASFDFLGCYAVHSSGLVSRQFFQSVNVPSGWFAYMSITRMDYKTDENGNLIKDDDDNKILDGYYTSPTENFFDYCNIYILTYPASALNMVNPGDVLCINYKKGLFINTSVLDPTPFEQSDINIIDSWEDYDMSKGDEYTISANLGYDLYLDVSDLILDISALNASINELNASTLKLDTSVRDIYVAVGSAFSGGSAGSATQATKLATAHTLWSQSFNGTQDVSGAISNASFVSLQASGTLGSNDMRPSLGMGKDDLALSLSGRTNVDIYTGTSNFVNLYSNAAKSSPGKLKIGNAVIAYDTTNKALQIYGSDGTGMSLYATGNISAYGASGDTGMKVLNIDEQINLGESTTIVDEGTTNFNSAVKISDRLTVIGDTEVAAMTSSGLITASGGIATDSLNIGKGGIISSISVTGTVMSMVIGSKTYSWTVTN